MPAFNARLRPKEIFGMPLIAALGLGLALIFGVLSLMLPAVALLLTLPAALAGLLFAAAGFFWGEELPWLPVMRLSRVENNRITSEAIDP